MEGRWWPRWITLLVCDLLGHRPHYIGAGYSVCKRCEELI